MTGNLERRHAFGNCPACPQPDGSWVPPRAQAAYQQAMYLARALPLLVRGRAAAPFLYRDKGSLVSLSEYSSVGRLMGSLSKGIFCRRPACQAHVLGPAQTAPAGAWLRWVRQTVLVTLSEMLDRTHRPRIKLH